MSNQTTTMNEAELALWAQKILASYSADFIDEEDNKISYEKGGDHVGLASDMFSVDDYCVQIRDGKKVLGGIRFSNEFDRKRHCPVADIVNYSLAVEHLVGDFAPRSEG